MSAKAGVAQASHKPARTRINLSWQDDAACADEDPDLFSTPSLFEQALEVCAPCTVKEQCALLGVGAGRGVWGGVIQRGQSTIHARDFLHEGCGTTAGYTRHIKAGEDACPACLRASAQYTARRVS